MKNQLITFLAIFSFLQFTISQESRIQIGEEWAFHTTKESAGYDSEALQAIDQYIIDSCNTTGLVVVADGKVLVRYGDIDDLSYVASVRKSVLALLYGIYVDNKTIDLNTTLSDLNMDDNEGLSPKEKEAKIYDLITARSGIYHPASNSGDNSADAPDRGSQNPGDYFLYNNWDFNAAGFVFEKITGMNIYDAIEKHLAKPLQMEDWDRGSQRKSGNTNRSQYLAYHMWFSTRDMARLGHLMLKKGNWNGTQVVPKKWVNEVIDVITPVEEMNPSRMRNGYFGYGYMWWVWDGPKVPDELQGAYSARGAWGQYITVIPKLDLVVAHKTNAIYRRSTSWDQYMGILNRIIDARLQK